MSADTGDESGGPGCVKGGCGCLGVGILSLVAIAVIKWLLNHLFFYYPFSAWAFVVSAGLVVGGGIAGAIVGQKMSFDLATVRRMHLGGKVGVVFGMLCLITAVAMSLRPAAVHHTAEVSADGGTVGPIEIPHDNVQAGTRIRQDVAAGSGRTYQRWSFVTVELLDENKDYVVSFGGDVWSYAGYDEGEHWDEEDEEYQTTVVFPSAGTYYFRLQTEANVGEEALGSIEFEMYERARWGNPSPLRLAAWLAFFFGAFVWSAPQVGRSERLRQHLEKGSRVRFDEQTWSVRGHATYVYDDWRAEEWTLHPTGPGGKTPRYLEREYELDSDWEEWFVSQPVNLDEIQCTTSEGEETTVGRYVATNETLPDAVTVEGVRYVLDDSGTTEREGTSLSYHTYEDDGGRFVTFEGDPVEEITAVVGRPVRVSEFRPLTDEDG